MKDTYDGGEADGMIVRSTASLSSILDHGRFVGGISTGNIGGFALRADYVFDISQISWLRG